MADVKKTVLIVDDEPDTLTYFASLLEDNGYGIITAIDSAECLARLEESIPDLITLDIAMPEKSGVKLYREMKENDLWKDIPVIVITGISEDFKRFITTRRQVPPPDGYLSKPIEKEELLAMVSKLTSRE